jgi:hypothetical protein
MSLDSQYSLSCNRPFARHVWFTSSKFQRAKLLDFRVALWPETGIEAYSAIKKTIIAAAAPIVVTLGTFSRIAILSFLQSLLENPAHHAHFHEVVLEQ